MKIGKRLLSMLLCLAMLLSMLPAIALAEEAESNTPKPLPTGDANSLTGAKPTTDVSLTVSADAIVVDSTVTDATTDYVLDWNGTEYANMFVYGTNLFATLAEAQEAVTPGGTVLVKSISAAESATAFTFTVGAKYYTENYNTLPYVVGTAFNGSDWTANEAYTSKAVTLGNVKFKLADADENDNKADAGLIELYGFSFRLSGSKAIDLNGMPDVLANFVIQNSQINTSGGSPVISMTTYADTKPNSKGASLLLKNLYLTGSCGKLFDEYNVDYLTLDGAYIPDDFSDTGSNIWFKTGASGGKSKLEFTNCNFQGWKGFFYFQMTNGKNWFVNKTGGTIAGAGKDLEWRPVYITNNIFNNSTLWEGSAFHQVHANATSKTVITGNRIINTGSVVPLLKNNHATYGNYFTLEMYNNYIQGYTDSPDFATQFMGGNSSVAKPYADIRNNFFSDNSDANTGTTYTISKTGDSGTFVTTTDWYLDPEMTFLNSAVGDYYIGGLSADNGDAYVYNLEKARTIVYNMKSGDASALKFTFKNANAKATWYSDNACTKAIDPSSIKAGAKMTAYVKVTIDGEPHSLVYSVYILKSDAFFATDFVEEDILTKDMLLVSNMNNDYVAGFATGSPIEYKLPHNNKTYTFIKGINAFSSLGDALAFAKGTEIVTPSIYFDYSKEGESLTITQSVKIIAPNYNVKPFDDKGFSESDKISDGTGTEAWTYNTKYDALKRTVADFKMIGNISPAVEIYGVELKSYLQSGTTYWGTNFDATGRAANDAACNFVYQNILITDAVSSIMRFNYNTNVEDDSALIKNVYLRSSRQGGQLSFNSEYMPETVVIDGLFADYNALGNDNQHSTRWYIKQGNTENSFTIKNSNLRNFYNQNNPFLTFMGNGNAPSADAGACKLIFNHNILYNFASGTTASAGEAFFYFEGNGETISNLILENNYISAPAGKSINLLNSKDSATSLKVDMKNNIIKGLADLGASRNLNKSSSIMQNYMTKVSTSDTTLPGEAIVLNGRNGSIAASKNYYIDYNMTVLNTDIAISNVTFDKGILETDEINNKFTGIVKEGTSATVADYKFDIPAAADHTWYEDSELTKVISDADLDKVDMYYTPIYLKIYKEGYADFYIVYSFDLKTERTPDNLFTETFVDASNLIDRNKAFIISKTFEGTLDGTYIETNFADDALYTFIKGENAFETVADAAEYAKDNNITTPHFLLLDKSGMSFTSGFRYAGHYFTANYDKSPYIKGNAVDGSDWVSNIGDGEGQFNPDKGISDSSLIMMSTADEGEYKFYGFRFTNQYYDKTARKRNIDVEIINSVFDRASWSTVLFTFGNEISGATDVQKAATETFKLNNVYVTANKVAVGGILFKGSVPANVEFNKVFIDVGSIPTTGINETAYNCVSTDRSFKMIDSCVINYFFKNAKSLKNTQTGKTITKNESSEYIIDGCTFVNFSTSGKGIFHVDMAGTSVMQITNNKVYNESFKLAIISSITNTNSTAVPMKLTIKNNYFNAVTNPTSITRSTTTDSVVEDNYALTTVNKNVGEVTYGGVPIQVNRGNTPVAGTGYFIDSELKYRKADAIPAIFVGEKTEKTETGAKYLITENDPVAAKLPDGTYDVNVNSIVKNPAGNKVEIKIGNETKALGNNTFSGVTMTDGEIVVTVISYALEGDDTNEQTLVLCTKLAQIGEVKVGTVDAVKNGETFTATLPADGENEAITATALAEGTTVTITDEAGAPVTNVSVAAGESKTYTISASVGSDSKVYTLKVTREAGEEADKSALIADIEALAKEANTAIDEESDEWLAGAKEDLINKVADALYAVDSRADAQTLETALNALKAAFEDAKNSPALIADYENMILEVEQISNADGAYCEVTFTALTKAITKAKADFEDAKNSAEVEAIIDAVANATAGLKKHSFTSYKHNAGTENCNSNGTKTAVCDTDGCYETKTVAETGNYKNDNHNFTGYKYNGDATMDADGTETGTCSRCGEKDTRTAAGTKLPKVDSSKKFKDVAKNAWYKQYVDYVASYGLMNGKSATEFDPNATITRAEFVQVLANLSGVNTANKNVTTKFSDVKSGAWYAPAVKWANDNGIVSGTSKTTFAPNANITREEMCVMLVQYASFRKIELNKSVAKQNFKDSAKISSWAKAKVEACQMAGLVKGDGTNFNPKNTAKRCEVAVIMSLFHADYLK